ncbi:Protein broad-minded [Trachymyrmex zeteki]|uniref:Protein broad-minded n=1 Tax=Mycetomoellerius zeteki TaxID=64791 RepID=A0A151XIU3_9HYME|nr:Protein broad-minded [Trachymyrmex zeteki]
MDKGIPPDLHKWLRKCLKKEFGKIIQSAIDEEQVPSDIAYKLSHSKDMTALLNSMKKAIAEQYVVVKPSSAASQSQSSLSFASDLAADDWASPQGNAEEYNCIIDKISRDKPVHVRLAGYEILLKIELSNINNSSQWDVFQKMLLDGLTDDNRAIFDASMQVHAKLLNCSQLNHTYSNLLNAFNTQYHSQKLRETLPTLISGINFKFFLHEKLFCIMHLIVRYQEEMLKNTRHSDKTVEEVIEQFIVFLSTHSFGNSLQPKTLNMLNIVSILEPQAKWSKRWLHSLSTRRIFIAILAKSPTFLQNVLECVKSGVAETPCSLSISIMDESNELCIPGNTIETATYLHCLTFVSQLCSYEAGRKLIAESSLKTPFDVADFLIELLNSLNKLAAEAPSGVAVKKVLLKMVSIPLGLQALVNEKLVFEELIRGLIAPLRVIWSSTDIVSFISSAGYFDLGYNVLANLGSHVLSTLLSQTCTNAKDPRCFAAFMVNDSESDDEEKDPSNLFELLQAAIDEDSIYHYLALLSLNTVIWNLDVCAYLLNLLNFQEILLDIQKGSTIFLEVRKEQSDDETDYKTEDDIDDGDKPEPQKEYIIDECSFLRHDILLKSYYMTYKRKQYVIPFEEYELFSEFPPPRIYADMIDYREIECDSELNDMLQEERPGLLDISWVSQVRAAHKASRCPIKNSMMMNLLNQMHKAIPTAEWVEQFEWQENITYDTDYWLPEDIHAINIVLNYAEQRNILKNNNDSQKNLKQFIHSAYIFIQYNKPNRFDGFDWFLATVFIICDGDVDNCKTFIMQVIQFPSTLLLWPKLGKVIDEKNNEGTSLQFTFMQVLETMVNIELPNIKYGLKDVFGVNWWMIFNRMLSQCFWGILPWSEIVHFFAICILYPSDYMVYYSVSLLQFCQEELLQDLTNRKMWPECMILDEYRCHNYITYMDNLGQRYRNRILPAMTKNLNSEDEI